MSSPPPRTERVSQRAKGLQSQDGAAILAVMQEAQREAMEVVRDAHAAIIEAAAAVAASLGSGHRIAFAGAGSAGLVALADGVELSGTFGLPADAVTVLFAGGMDSLNHLSGAAEDDTKAGAREVDRAGLGAGDSVICVSASGTTPYCLSIADGAASAGATVIGIACNPATALLERADIPILLATPEEIVSGSTRLGAATAQKVALNMLSTLVGMRLGHVHDGHMVNVVVDNAKLEKRAIRAVAAIGSCSPEMAERLLIETAWRIKPATLLARGVSDAAQAAALLEASDGHLDVALGMLRGG